MRPGKLTLLVLTLLLAVGFAPAQTGTPHGILVTWNAPSPVGGSGTIQGYYLFRCAGVTVTASCATSVGALLPAVPTSYLDPASGLSTNTTYSYVAVTVDSNGNQSAYSGMTSTVVGNSFPSNPNPPGGCNSKVQ
jgi:hypothetical protein